ncbi:MAG TPA: phage baseplate assembly protein V [Streptosporangiaceae bacterium]|jgi:phage protein D
MTTPDNVFTTAAAPTVLVGPGVGQPLSDDTEQMLLRAVVDTSLHLPGMFELTFLDSDGTLLSTAGISMGTRICVYGCAAGSDADQVLIEGEVTCLEAICRNLNCYSIVRGYDLCHRMQRARRTRTFLNATDSDIATQIAKAAGLTKLEVKPSTAVHAFVGQCNQTDWDFLSQRAREIGYDVGISAGTFRFGKAASVAASTALPVELTFPVNLRRFAPRVTAGNMTPSVEVRVWDPLQAKIVGNTKETATGTAAFEGTTAPALAAAFVSDTPPAATAQPGAPAVGNLGPAPASTAQVIYDRPVAIGAAIDSAVTDVAASLADQVASTFAEADGAASGDPSIQPGAVVSVSGVPEQFCGSWLITNARHVFDLREAGYTTQFVVSGRQERSLLSLATAGQARPKPPRMPGVYCGVVTNNNDPQQTGQVKVALPWLSPDYETDWSPVIQFGAGKRSGALFLPEVGDEVLVAFEFGDPRRAYVLGGVVNSGSQYSLGGPAIKATGETATVALRGFVSAAGNQLVFGDQIPPGEGSPPPSVSTITLGTGDGSLALAIDQVAGTITLSCSPKPPNSKAEQGTLSIQCGQGGTINVAAGQGGTVNIDGGANLNLKAQSSISIQSSGQVSIKGSQIQLN